MWRKEEILIALQKQYVPKCKIAKVLTLNKPWNRYKREEFVDVIYEEMQYNTELFNLLSNAREQQLAKDEYKDLYFKDWNTTPPAYRPEGWHDVDWIEQLNKYKEKRVIK
ncbi:hypothetical protein [Bacillus cereus]|uniref:Uncharacterized protein n=1 Tax=Bacillus cereus TaxID=1396 RepID=A0A9X6ZZ92_BACCE|nr:hypothetical protein [Bacillus cereus]PFK16535.1 hypothetical protein COI98_16295 [Bacillus cereus]